MNDYNLDGDKVLTDVLRRSGTKRKRGDDPHEHGLDNLRSGPADVFSIIEYSPDVNPSPDAGGPSNAPEEAAASDEEGSWELLFVKEAKAPHKLSATMIDRAVGNPNKLLEPDEIMGRGLPESGDDSEEASEFWFAAVCAQLYSSMIQLGLRYGVITTGVRYVFVSIDPDGPSTLRYSISQNTSRVHESPLLRLVSLAFRAIQHGRFKIDDSAVRSIRGGYGLTWRTASESSSPSGTEEEGQSPETESWGPSQREVGGNDGSGSEGRNDSVSKPTCADDPCTYANPNNIPYLSPPQARPSVLGKRRRHAEVEGMDRKRHQRLEGSSQASVLPTTPMPSPPSSPAPPSRRHLSKVPYCNTACLRSILSNIDEPQSKDSLCPNHAEHERHGRLTGEALRQGIKDLIENPVYDDDGNSQLQYYFLPHSFYTRPVMVKLRFHGYTILGKAFPNEDLSTLHREARVYHRLRHLQGGCVPVCLGTIELLDQSLWHFGWDFTSLLLLGFGGCAFKSWPHLGLGIAECKGESADRLFAKELTAEVQKAVAQIHEAGVVHKDVALRNVLITEASRREGSGSEPEIHLGVRLIDFGLSRTRREYRDRAERRRKRQNMDVRIDGKHAGEVEFAEACEKEMTACPGAMEKWCAN